MNKNVPQIRFQGFHDDWEQRKLKELAFFSKGQGYSKSDLIEIGDEIILYGRLYTKYETVINTVDTFTNKKSKSILSKGMEVIVPASGETPNEISRASVVDRPGVILGGDLNIIHPNEDINSEFLALTLSNGQQQKELSRRAQGKSVVHLRTSDLKKVDFLYPSIEEQQKISKLIVKFENLITLHQRKLNLLQKQKKSLLQKMFPKKDEKIPEIRFNGFTDDWEQRKFDELSQLYRGLTYKPSDVRKDGIRVLRSSNIVGNTFTIKNDDVFVKPDVVKISTAQKNDILITAANGSSSLVGKHALIDDSSELMVHGGFMLLAKSREPEFTNALMNSQWYRNFIFKFVAGGNGAIGNLKKSDLENQNILIPFSREQKQIGRLFSQLDNLITLHQRKLDALQEQKKGLLQKMFV